MKKNHVGRPTNKEIFVRKRNKVIITMSIAMIALMVVIAGKISTDKLMGASIGCYIECDGPEWTADNEKRVCYKQNVDENEIDAIVLDNNTINNNTYNTNSNNEMSKYACPQSRISEEEDDIGQIIIINTVFTLKGKKCLVKETTRIEVEGQTVCNGGTFSGQNSSSKTKESTKSKTNNRSFYSSTGYKPNESSSSTKKSTSKKTSIFKKKSSSYKPKKGDIIFFSQSGSVVNHVAIVYKVDGNDIKIIEGNSGTNSLYTSYVKKSKASSYGGSIVGYIDMSKVISRDKARKIANLAHKQIGNKGNKYWKNTKAWYGSAAEWCAIFVAWNLEQKGVNPSKVGWSASCTKWVNQAKKIKK